MLGFIWKMRNLSIMLWGAFCMYVRSWWDLLVHRHRQP